MKKITLLLFIGLAFSAGAMAQSKDVKNDQKTLENTIKDKKEDRAKVGNDITKLKVKSAMQERREVRRHRRSIRKQGRHLKNHGVKHPIGKAKQKVKEDKENRKGKD